MATKPSVRLRLLRLNYSLPRTFESPVLEQWFIDCLALQPASLDARAIRSEENERPLHAAYVARVVALAAQLMRVGRVPAFGDGVVIDLPRPGQALVGLPEVDLIDGRCYSIAAEAANALCLRMASTPYSPEALAELEPRIARCQRELLSLSQAGKSTIPVLEAAWRAGIPFCHLGRGIYQLGWGSRSLKLDRSTTDNDAALGARLAQDKLAAAALLRHAGLPAPQHELAKTAADAGRIAQRLGWPVVVKPADGDRGEGVTVDVESVEVLNEAFARARARSSAHRVLIERQVPGVCHRLFVAAGRLLYAVKRLPKSVIGDGQASVAQLIDRANRAQRERAPWLRSEPWPSDEAAQAALAAAGFAMSAVPAPGAVAPLRRIESTADGGRDEDVTGRLHPHNLDIALRAARLFSLDVAGIDIISEDIGCPWYENGAVINEVNYAPLLGGGEISLRHLPEFLSRVLPGDGRIPVEAVIGEAAAQPRAEARRRALCKAGLRAWRVSDTATIAPDGSLRPVAVEGVAARLRALLLDKEVDAVVLSVDSVRDIARLPVDRVASIHRASAPALQS